MPPGCWENDGQLPKSKPGRTIRLRTAGFRRLQLANLTIDHGLPIVAALRQGIPVIAVQDKVHSTSCENLVRELPWRAGQYIEVSNYKEVIGCLAALKEGIAIEAIERPIRKVKATGFRFDTELPQKVVVSSDAPHVETNGKQKTVAK